MLKLKNSTILFYCFCFIQIFSQLHNVGVNVTEIWKYKGSVGCVGWWASSVFDKNSGLIVSAVHNCVFAVDINTELTTWEHCYFPPDTRYNMWTGVMMIEDFRFSGDTLFFVGHKGPTLTVLDVGGTIVHQGDPDSSAGGGVMSISGFKFTPNGEWKVLVGTSIHRNWEVAFVYDTSFNIEMRLPVGRDQEDCFSLGVYAQNCVVGDLTRNGVSEMVIPSDHVGLCNFNSSGLPVIASSVFKPYYGSLDNWGRIVTDANWNHEITGWQTEPTGVDYNLYFTQGMGTAFVFYDSVSNKNYSALAIVGKYGVNDINGFPIWLNSVLFLYFADAERGREKFYVPSRGWDWRYKYFEMQQKRGTHVINQARMPPAIIDLTGNGLPEIILPMDDTKIHAFNLNQEEFGYWPYQIPQCTTAACYINPKGVGSCSYAGTTDESYCANDQTAVYGSEIVAFQRPNEGPIVVFGTLPGYNNNNYGGKLIFLYYNGRELKQINLPPTANPPVHKVNGIRPCPTLFRYENKSRNLFINVQTMLSYNMMYEIEDTHDAKILWATSRGNFQRTGFVENIVKVYPFELEPMPNYWWVYVIVALSVSCMLCLVIGLFVALVLVSVFFVVRSKNVDNVKEEPLETMN